MLKLIQENWAPLLLAALIGILAISPSFYFHYFDDGYRGIEFFGSDAENHYLGQVQEIYDGYWGSGNIYSAENKSDPYVQQPLPAIIMALLGKFLGISARDVNMLAKFLFPAFLTIIVYLFFYSLIGRKDIALVMAAFVMLVQATWIFLNPSAWLPFLLKGEFRGTDYNFISYTRPINPQISSIFFFGYLLCLWKFLFKPLSEKSEKIYGAASAVILGLSFYIYFFTFSFLSALNAMLFFWFLLLKNWRQLKKITFISIGALVIAIPYFLNVWEMTKLPSYQQLSQRTGSVESRQFVFSRVWWGVTAVFLLFYRGARETKALILAFLATAFLVTNQQVITGKTVPLLVHYHWYYIAPVGGAILIHLLFFYLEKAVLLRISRAVMVLALALFFYAGILYQRVSFAKQYDDFIYQQRYAPVLSWLDQNIKDESVIFTNEDLASLTPAYTRHNVYYSGLLTDSLVSEERIRHSVYVYFLLNGITANSAKDFFYQNKNWIGGRIFSDHYRMQNGCYGCFPDSILDGLISEYRDFLNKDFLSEFQKYQVDYVVWDKEKNSEWRLDRFFSNRVYDQDNMIIYHVL